MKYFTYPSLKLLFFIIFLLFGNCAYAQYDEKYYKKYLPAIATQDDAVLLLKEIVGKLSADDRRKFEERYLAFSLQSPNREDCNEAGNLGGIRKIDVRRLDKKNILLYLCREQIVFAAENSATLLLLITTVTDMSPSEVEKFLVKATAETSETAIGLFDVYKKQGWGFMCYPAGRAYQLRRGAEAKCWGEQPQVFADYMAPLMKKNYSSMNMDLGPDLDKENNLEFYFGMAEAAQEEMGNWILIFTILHEIGHIVHDDANDQQKDLVDAETEADSFAFQYINKVLAPDRLPFGSFTLAIVQIQLTALNISAGGHHSLRSQAIDQTRSKVSAQKTMCEAISLLSKNEKDDEKIILKKVIDIMVATGLPGTCPESTR